MAGPNNGFNARKQPVTVYATDGTPVETTRPNAIDMVRRAGYSWNLNDAGKNRVESEGPEDPSSKIAVIYDAEGNKHETDTRNARELVQRGDYTWTLNGMTEQKAAEEVLDAAKALTDAVEAAATAVEPVAEESLTEEALRVAGNADVAKYLDGFSLDALKSIASERYGESIHHRASKETAITKIVEMEEALQLSE